MIKEVEEAVRLKLKKFVLVNNKYPSAGTLLKNLRGTNKAEISQLLDEVQKEYPNFIHFLAKVKNETKMDYNAGDKSLIEIVDVLVEGNNKISRYYTNNFNVKEGSVIIINYYGNNTEGVVVSEPYHVYKDFVSYEYKPIISLKGEQSLRFRSIEEITEFVSNYLLLNKNFDQINKSREYSECLNKDDIDKVITDIKKNYLDIEEYRNFYKKRIEEDCKKNPENYLRLVDVERVYKHKVILKPYIVEEDTILVGDVVVATVYEERGKVVSECYYVLKKYCKDLTPLKRTLNISNVNTEYVYRLEIIAAYNEKEDIEMFLEENRQTGMRKLIGAFEKLFDFYNRFYCGEENNYVEGFYNVDYSFDEFFYITLEFSMRRKLKNEKAILDDIVNVLKELHLRELLSKIMKVENPDKKKTLDFM